MNSEWSQKDIIEIGPGGVETQEVKREMEGGDGERGDSVDEAETNKQGFGATARSTLDTRKLDPSGIVVFHQADVGEFLRDEDTMF